MNRVLALAASTFQEAIRHRILYLLLFFAVGMIAASRLLSMLTVGEDDKIIKDVGMSAINVFGVLIALFVGVGLIFREMEKRTVLVTLSGPVARWEYLLGKYFGLAGAITLNAALMALMLFGILLYRGAFSGSLVTAVFMLWVELMFITSVAVFFSTLSTPIFSALFTAGAYIVGHMTWSLPMLEAKVPEGFWRDVVHGLYLLLPDLEYGDVRALAVHGVEIPFDRVLWGTVYGLSYAGLLLLAACLIFRRRDLV